MLYSIKRLVYLCMIVIRLLDLRKYTQYYNQDYHESYYSGGSGLCHLEGSRSKGALL